MYCDLSSMLKHDIEIKARDKVNFEISFLFNDKFQFTNFWARN